MSAQPPRIVPSSPWARGVASWRGMGLGLAALVVLGWTAGASAQPKPTPRPDPAAANPAPPRPADKKKEDRPPPPIELKGSELTTRDGVLLRATFFPSNKGKEAVPILLLHGWKGSRTEYARLAFALQSIGHAVLVPDLRAHGESKSLAYDEQRELDPARIGPNDLVEMVKRDMEKLKSFLVQRHNAGELNLEKLCVVGADMGAVVAMNWAVWDWHWPVYPEFKQGQYVKALVLISPPWSFKGIDVSDAVNHPAIRGATRVGISVQIIYGADDRKAATDAERIHKLLQQQRPKFEDEAEAREKQDLWILPVAKTKLQGTKLVAARGPEIYQAIASFVYLRLVVKDYPWHEIKEKP